MAYVIGITGGIASGKTIVSDYLIEKGFAVLDADIVARDVVSPGSDGLQAIANRFGEEILLPDGTLNRRQLGENVFANPEALTALNAILHPLIKSQIKARILALPEDELLFLVVPLLYETNFHPMCDEVWLVTAPIATRIQRLMQRNQLTENEAQQRIAAQLPDEEKFVHQPLVFQNTGTPQDLIRHVHHILMERKLIDDTAPME